jgi:hypothetical protein
METCWAVIVSCFACSLANIYDLAALNDETHCYACGRPLAQPRRVGDVVRGTQASDK